MSNSSGVATASTERRKVFPIRCVRCGRKEVWPAVISYEADRNHDGRIYRLHLPELHVNQCANCGEVYLGADADEQMSAALRDQLGLLTPEQIRANLTILKLSQKEAAGRLGIAAETLSRWLSGAMIQSRAMDNLLRAFFGCSEVREQLIGENQDRNFGVESLPPEAKTQQTGVPR